MMSSDSDNPFNRVFDQMKKDMVFTADEMKALCLEIIAFIDRKLYP